MRDRTVTLTEDEWIAVLYALARLGSNKTHEKVADQLMNDGRANY